ncbi:hypothetical protein GCM10017776_08420 [Streptomyces griseoluteus]|nr:hypothetical protein GCM10017776_08420 [Streptomyces griseoluteus]
MPVGAAGVGGRLTAPAAAVMCCAASRAPSFPADPVVIAFLETGPVRGRRHRRPDSAGARSLPPAERKISIRPDGTRLADLHRGRSLLPRPATIPGGGTDLAGRPGR